MVNLTRRPVVDPDRLADAIDAIQVALGVRLRASACNERLDAAGLKRLVKLASIREPDADERAELRSLVDVVAPGLVERYEEARAENARQLEAIGEAAQGEAVRILLPLGAAVLPVSLLDDVHDGRLLPIELATTSLVLMTLATGKVSDYAARSGGARFESDGTLVVRGGRLLEDLDPGAEVMQRVLSMSFNRTLDRLSALGWLSVERQGDEARIRPGRRLEVE